MRNFHNGKGTKVLLLRIRLIIKDDRGYQTPVPSVEKVQLTKCFIRNKRTSKIFYSKHVDDRMFLMNMLRFKNKVFT